MAKNYSFAEAVEIIAKGTDFEAIADIGKRYPILLNKITKVAAKAGNDFVDLAKGIPEHISANKVNSMFKNGIAAATEEDTEEPVKEEVKDETKEEVKEDSKENDYENMSGKELWDILGKKGLRAECKKKYGTKKADIVKFLKEVESGANEDEAAEDEEATENAYDNMSAVELFKECKKRGIKAEPKKPAKVYKDMLLKDDAAKATEEEDEDDSWDDEDEVVKPAAKSSKKSEKKAKEEVKEDEDDDDDWDI